MIFAKMYDKIALFQWIKGESIHLPTDHTLTPRCHNIFEEHILETHVEKQPYAGNPNQTDLPMSALHPARLTNLALCANAHRLLMPFGQVRI